MPWILSILLCMTAAFANTFEENPALQSYFETHHLKGTFIVYDPTQKAYKGYNFAHAKTPFSPASTFKIWNALIALNQGVVQSTDEIFYTYQDEGKNKNTALPSWKKDASLKSAISISQVPAFQTLALKIGRSVMQENLYQLQYGNEAIGTRLDYFWLDGTLRISPLRQVELLRELSTLNLHYPKKIQRDVLKILILEQTSSFTLYGKTGLSVQKDQSWGWFVGILKAKNNLYPFALHIEIPKENQDFIQKRIEIAKQCLELSLNLNHIFSL